MAQHSGKRTSLGLWLVRLYLIYCVPTLVFLAVPYMRNKAAAEAYAQAPQCAPGVTDSSSCRLMTDAELLQIKCPLKRPLGYRPGELCQLELQVAGGRGFLSFLPALTTGLTPGARLRVELFRGGPTGAQLGDRFVPQSNPPQGAAQILLGAMAVILASALWAARYLWRRKKRAAESTANPQP
jgi:hypothetical protein